MLKRDLLRRKDRNRSNRKGPDKRRALLGLAHGNLRKRCNIPGLVRIFTKL